VSPPDRRTDRVAGDRALESQIDRAIRDRAISGVRVVSASDGTVFLDGRVATARQKLAAVRAALSVPGVKNIRDQIAVQWPGESSDRASSDAELEAQVDKAIRDRAISGVRIASIDDGTVFLDGRVATMRQKLAAVRAALSVPGVKNVRDRIVVQ
ncbi:MAG TPA: BON domain-containing protein, partial [Methylomirabilota bacterium]|nr:BON domain-containing protein [Methylomirabilota bacterium]